MNDVILIAEDERQIALLQRTYLQEAGYKVEMVQSGDSVIPAVHLYKPSLLVLDVMLPNLDGWEILKRVRTDQKIQSLPIIMVTARIEDSDKIIGLELGADDYLTKPFNPRELVARVRALLRRSQQTAVSNTLTVGRFALETDSHRFFRDDEEIELTPTEFKLLEKLLAHPNSTFEREELLAHAVGYGYEGLSRTLDSHIRNVRRKIEQDPKKPEHLQTVYGIGYRFVP